MKQFFATALLATLLAPAAFAQDLNDAKLNNVDQTQAEQTQHEMKTSVGDIIKKIIGGAIEAGVLDRDAGRGGYREQVTCYAQNRRGEVFRAVGVRPRMVQQRAIDQCYSVSRFCAPAGCEVARGGGQRDPRDDRRDDPRDRRDDQRDPRDGQRDPRDPRDPRH